MSTQVDAITPAPPFIPSPSRLFPRKRRQSHSRRSPSPSTSTSDSTANSTSNSTSNSTASLPSQNPLRIANLAALASTVLRPRSDNHTVRYIAQVDIESWMVRRNKVGTTRNMLVVLDATTLSVYKAKATPHRYQVNVRSTPVTINAEKVELHIYLAGAVDGKPRLLRLHIASLELALKWKKSLENAVQSQISDYFSFIRPLGSGAYGEVMEASNVLTGEKRAVKIIKRGSNMKSQQHLESEIQVMKCISHPNIVKTYQIFDLKRTIYIVMEHVPGGDLFDFVAQHNRLTETQAAQTMQSIFFAVEHLHRNGIVHRDLKPENILCANKSWPLEIKVTDFGFSRFIDPSEESANTMRTQVGTVYFMAPEILTNNGHGPAVDLWACGVILYTILTGRLPFPGKNTYEYFNNVREGKVLFPGVLWKDISGAAMSLVKGLLNVDPNKRLTSLGALQHTWIESPTQYSNEIRRDRSNLHSRRRRLFKARSAIIAVAMASKFKATIPQVVDKVGDSTRKVVDGVGGGLKKTAGGVKRVGEEIGEGSKKVANEIGEGTKKMASEIGEGTKKMASEFGEGTKKVAEGIAGGTKKVAGGIGTGVKKTVDGVELGARKVGEGVKKTADGIEIGIKKTADGLGDGLKKTADGLGGGLKKTADGLGGGLKKTADGLGGGLKKTADGLGGGLKKTADGLGDGLKKTADGLGGGLKKTADGLGGGLKKTADGLGGGLKKTADGLGGGLKRTGEGLKKTGEGIRHASIQAGAFLKLDRPGSSTPNGSQSDSTPDTNRRRQPFRWRGNQQRAGTNNSLDTSSHDDVPSSASLVEISGREGGKSSSGGNAIGEVVKDRQVSSSDYYSAIEEHSENEEGWARSRNFGDDEGGDVADNDSDVTPPGKNCDDDDVVMSDVKRPGVAFREVDLQCIAQNPGLSKEFSNISCTSTLTPTYRPNLAPLDGLPMGLSDDNLEAQMGMDCESGGVSDDLRRTAAMLLATNEILDVKTRRVERIEGQ